MIRLTSSFARFIAISFVALFTFTAFAELPRTGDLKSVVLENHGQPDKESPSIGQPPISKWTYPNMTVVFEHDHVIHAYSRIKSIEERSAEQIPSRPGFVNLIDQSQNKPMPSPTKNMSKSKSKDLIQR